jgi:UDP-2,3-diacylglucosamine pyrophosphatase LpxH
MRILVISDLHLASGQLDDFDRELEGALVEFFGKVSSEKKGTELVINGDFLDFVQAEPWQSPEYESETSAGVPLCFTEHQSLQKLKTILETHSKTFCALSDLLKSENIKRLTILPGNHDADLFWPKVRAELVRRLGQKSERTKLQFHLEKVYQPASRPDLWIEHGHQHDPCNSFKVDGVPYWSANRTPLLKDKSGEERLLECVGTRFMLKFLNKLDFRYPFVDNVKPFSKFVKMFLLSGFSSEFGPLAALTVYWALIKFLAGRLASGSEDFLDLAPDSENLFEDVKRSVRNLSRKKEEQFRELLSANGFALNGMTVGIYLESDRRNPSKLLDFLSDHPGVRESMSASDEGYLSVNDDGYLTLGRGFSADETGALQKVAREVIASKAARFVVMGHTHEAVEPMPDLNYVNTGCWIRYLRKTAERSVSGSWALLREAAFDHFPFELAYAELEGERLVREVFRP